MTFGKGLQIAGVASVDRNSTEYFSHPARPVTLDVQNEALLKATQVLNRIREGKLMENAAASGRYLLQRLQKNWLVKFRANLKSLPKDQREQAMAGAVEGLRESAPRGIGTLIFSKEKLPCEVESAMGRLMPPMTITTQQIDQLFSCK